MKRKQALPELLAPAGTLAAALAAYAAGADAVYCGLGRFNAREMGSNFSFEDLSRLAARAKALGKRFYLTLNTLVKETEWEAFGETVAEAAALEPDAVILQDPGVARFMRTWYPRIELHASTQMGIHNSAGIEAAAGMGLSRVILERQASLDELGPIIADSPLEVEVFIHGALCCSLSGNCLFSSWMGGWSGNRGRCKQPCRRRFHGREGGEAKSGFFFSTQDLYTLDLIGMLKELGVASFKIEGRLKQPDYVDRVVRSYRMILDAPPEEERKLLGEARRILAGSYGRRWSHGFAAPEDRASLIQYDSPGVSGQLVGVLRSVGSGGVAVKLSRPVKLGDRLRIQSGSGEESPSFTLTAMKIGDSRVTSAGPGREVFIPLDRDSPSEGRLYRVGGANPGGLPDAAALPLFRPPRRFDLEIGVGADAIRVAAAGMSWEREIELAPARKHSLSAQQVGAEFARTRRDELAAGEIKVSIDGDYFLPASGLKTIRREFWDWFAGRLPSDSGTPEPDWRSLLQRTPRRPAGAEPDAVMLRPDQRQNPRPDCIRVVPLPSLGAYDPELEYLLPHFCPEGRIADLAARLGEAIAAGCRRFRVSALFQLPMLRRIAAGADALLVLTAAYPLPVANSLAAAELADRGVSRVQGWIELERESLESLRDFSPLPLEIYRYGRPPLLATRAEVPVEGEISDSRGGRFLVVPPEPGDFGELTLLYPRQAMAIPGLEGTAGCFDYRNAEPDEEDTVAFNFDRELV